MREIAVRLKKGQDLKKSILDICINNNILSGVVVGSVGSLTCVNIRNASASRIVSIQKPLEIISLNGTVSKNRIHLHICVSDENLQTFGGHLENDSIVDTTCELVILELNDYTFKSEFDKTTGYNEIIFERKN